MKNKGMYIEELINNTITYYNTNNIGWFEKRHLPIAIKEINKNKVVGYLKEKSTVDYFGVYKSRHIEFESKQTDKDYFSFALFKSHQIEYLYRSTTFGSISFLIIHFFNHNKTYAINADNLKELFQKFRTKKIKIDILKQYGIDIQIVFPGILNISEYLDTLIK